MVWVKSLPLAPFVGNTLAGETVGILRCDAGVEAWGTLAEKTVVPASSVAPVPQGWSLEEMAGAPLVFLTEWRALTQWSEPRAAPREGSVLLLVTEASGGVGAASVLLGKSMGLTVLALSRSTEKGARLKELGADFVFNPADEKMRKELWRRSIQRKLTLIRPPYPNIAITSLNSAPPTLSTAMVVGRSGGAVPEFNPAALFFRRNRIGGVSVGDYTPEAAQAAWR
jgi:NADPH:quinone reductase